MSKISIEKVQKAFNAAIKRRDCRCVVHDFDPCYGELECSHFYTVGGNPALRFFPPNAYAQCKKHHWKHHNVSERPYVVFMETERDKDLEYMRSARSRFIKYTDVLKAEIMRLCNEDKLDELAELIKSELN